jgi:uncharacterized protein involved in copper resistance
MKTIGQRSLAAAFGLAIALNLSALASAQQQTPDTQKDAPAQQTTPAQPAPGMGPGMMRDGMEHGKMGRKGMDGEHGKMGGRMHQGGSDSKDAPSTTGASPSTNSTTAPPTGSK